MVKSKFRIIYVFIELFKVSILLNFLAHLLAFDSILKICIIYKIFKLNKK